MIRTEQLTRDYGSGRGLSGLNLAVPKGKIFGYIGPNGAGKTTTIKMLCGLLQPTSGRAFINGVEVLPKNSTRIKKMIGYMPDIFGVYDQMSVWEYLDFFGAAYHIPPKARAARIHEVLEITNAHHMLDYQIASLSRGMHQRIGLAKTMLHDPLVLILDEPASGLDPHARIEMRKTIMRLRELGKTILLSSHILPELASVCDLVGILEKGRLVAQGTVADITRQIKENLELRLTVDSDPAQALAVCQAFAGVAKATADENELRLTFTGARATIADLNAKLVMAGVRVLELKEEEANLEQVFLSVTGQAAATPAPAAAPSSKKK
ncbi:MAG: ABC transporter ATP-binding protein [Lentisphaeria bacterium]